MGGTELKTDSSQRWVMYSKEAYRSGRIFLTVEQKQAIENGKQFAQRAYADVWAKDAALVKRVRSFLGTNFYWHERLAKNGADLEVVETLQSMIRGESVVLVAEQPRSGGAPASATRTAPKVASFRETLMTDYRMSYDAATEYIERYNIAADKINAALERSASARASSQIDDVDDFSDSFSEAGAFKYAPDTLNGVAEELAASTNNPRFAAKMLGYDQNTFSDILHNFKPDNGLGPADNVIWHDNGDVYFDGRFIANFHDWAN